MPKIINFLMYEALTGNLGAIYYCQIPGDQSGEYVPLAEYQRDLANAETDKRVMMEAADTIAELRREVELLQRKLSLGYEVIFAADAGLLALQGEVELSKELYTSTLQILNDTREQRNILENEVERLQNQLKEIILQYDGIVAQAKYTKKPLITTGLACAITGKTLKELTEE